MYVIEASIMHSVFSPRQLPLLLPLPIPLLLLLLLLLLPSLFVHGVAARADRHYHIGDLVPLYAHKVSGEVEEVTITLSMAPLPPSN